MKLVRQWLESNGFGEYADLFESHGIDAEAFSILAERHLRDIGVPLGPSLKLLAARARVPLSSDQSACGAERRRLTVMFVDLVESTELSFRMDPEDLRGLIRAFQGVVAGQAKAYGAYVAQYLGDGAMVYFGYPAAHEDDAERAIRTALAIMRELAALAHPGDRVALARIGIATGLVVVGDLIGQGAVMERAVVGETPNLAARLQSLAAPGEIIISEQTRLLAGGYFEVQSLGTQKLRGIETPTPAFRVVGEHAVQSRFEARQRSIGALVGRDEELALLRSAAGRVQSGTGQIALIGGDAGIGKSRMVHELLNFVAGKKFTAVRQQCSAYHADSALFPITQQILRAANIKTGDDLPARLDRLELLFHGASHEELALVAAMLGIDGSQRYGKYDLTPQQQRSRTFDALFGQLGRLAAEQPVIWVLEDAHWVDPTTLEMLQRFGPQIENLRLLVIVTARPGMLLQFGEHAPLLKVDLPRLDRPQATKIVETLTRGKRLPKDLLSDILARAEGIPLYVEEITKAMLESSSIRETEDAFVVERGGQRPAVPASLHDGLMARLDRMQPFKVVAQTAACIGREFEYQLLAAVCLLPESTLREALTALEKAELIYPRGSRHWSYSFKHALVRDAAYESLLHSNRQLIHTRLTRALEEDPKSAPEVIAQHAAEAGLTDKAIKYWRKAAMLSAAKPAYREAISHLRQAIELAGRMETTIPWLECRLGLWVALGQVSIPYYGYGHSSTATAFARARELTGILGDIPQRFSIEYANWLACYVRGEHAKAIDAAARMIDQSQDHQGSRLAAMRALGISQMVTGNPIAASETFDQAQVIVEALRERSKARGTAIADRYAADPEISTQFHVGLTWWSLGRVDEAWKLVNRSLDEARAINHAHTMSHGVAHGAIFAVVCHDVPRALALSAEAIEIAERFDMELWRGYGLVLHGFALALSGDLLASVPFMEQGFASLQQSETGAMIQIHHAMHAKTLALLGRPEQAGLHAAAAYKELQSGSERYLWPECQRLLGDYLRCREDSQPVDIEQAYQRAVQWAREQGSISWQLYAATSLAKWYGERGQADRARDLVEPLLASMQQGLDSVGCQEARSLLNGLHAGAGAA